MMLLTIIGGLALLVAGGDLLVRGGASLARRLGVSELMIGLTLVGFGTSTPELITSLDAAFAGAPGISIGNVVGSNSANILFILGVAALVQPVAVPDGMLRRDGSVVLLAAVACLGVVLIGELQRWLGAVLVMALLVYVAYTYLRERTAVPAPAVSPGASEPTPHSVHSVGLAVALAAAGLLLAVVGAHLLVTGAIQLADRFAVSETVVGLTIVAVGTSLPELATTLVAAARRQSDIAFGNIIGSNIYNVFGILGVTALVHPIPVPAAIIRLDIWVMLAATILLVVFCASGRRLSRGEGATLLAGYAAYLTYLGLNV